jgi:DNA-binding transcriptional LysR family regulator
VRPTESDLIARRVGETTAHFYASQRWVESHGLPCAVADLSGADLLAFEPLERFVAYVRELGAPIDEQQCRVVSNNSFVLWEMLQRGLGVSIMLPEIAEHTPGVVRLLPDLAGPSVPVWLVCHRELHTSRRVRVVFDALFSSLRACIEAKILANANLNCTYRDLNACR